MIEVKIILEESAAMEDKGTAMLLSMRKLALWSSRNGELLSTHGHLEPVMSALGFTSLPPTLPIIAGGTRWKEYVFAAGGAQGHPRPKLPYPRIDGLHNHTYRAFLEAVNFHLRRYDVSTVFHVRGMPVNRDDLHGKWRPLEEGELAYIYREGTLDQATHKRYSNSESGVYDFNPLAIRDKGVASDVGQVVPLEDIIASRQGDDKFKAF